MAIWNPHGIALSTVPDVELNSGYRMPMLGMGTWQAEPQDVGQALENAIDAGYRHFDCAPLYGNEDEIGEILKKKISQGIISREDIFLTTKLPLHMNDPAHVREAIKTSLKQLKVNYVDLYLVHWPISICRKEYEKLGPDEYRNAPENPGQFFNDMDPTVVWKEMEKLVEEGLAKSIGLSNFNEKQIQKILGEARTKPSVLQVECHAYFPQKELVGYCRKNDIVFCAYAPLASPNRWNSSQKPVDPVLLNEPVLKKMANKYGKTPAQVLLRWLIQRDIVVIPKTTKKNRLQENFAIWDFNVSDADCAQIASLARTDGRLFTCDQWKDSPNYPFQ